MSNEEDWRSGKTQRGVGAASSRSRDRGLDDTLPGTQPLTIANRSILADDDGDVATSASVATLAATAQTSGSVSISGDRVSEALAREVIVRRMANSGIQLQADYAFSHGDLLLRLDGYDPSLQVGYQFISHAGADVVTDFDDMAEERLAQLDSQGIVHILVIHDHQAPDTSEVLRRVENFLEQLAL